MYLDDKRQIVTESHTSYYETNEYAVWWEGILWTDPLKRHKSDEADKGVSRGVRVRFH